jgi:hypothetical protein
VGQDGASSTLNPSSIPCESGPTVFNLPGPHPSRLRRYAYSLNNLFSIDVELAPKLKKSTVLIDTALDVLKMDEANQQLMKTSLGALTRVVNEANRTIVF